jgi:phospholipid/cholesterol/gamma-HCH transport system ATP-binding protein
MIEIQNLWKSFGENHVLKGLNLKVENGETIVIMGQSGCGKSVLLKLIIGLLKPDKGKIIIEGMDIVEFDRRKLQEIRMNFGFVFQQSALFDSLNIRDNVAFGMLQHTSLSEELIDERVKECLFLVDLENIEDKLPQELSGGMKKRVAIARAICLNPKIILYDEPTTGLDPITADAINKLIKKLHDKTKVTSIVVTHDIKSAFSIGDKIGMLYDGKIIEIGTVEEVKNTQNPILKKFISGESE